MLKSLNDVDFTTIIISLIIGSILSIAAKLIQTILFKKDSIYDDIDDGNNILKDIRKKYVNPTLVSLLPNSEDENISYKFKEFYRKHSNENKEHIIIFGDMGVGKTWFAYKLSLKIVNFKANIFNFILKKLNKDKTVMCKYINLGDKELEIDKNNNYNYIIIDSLDQYIEKKYRVSNNHNETEFVRKKIENVLNVLTEVNYNKLIFFSRKEVFINGAIEQFNDLKTSYDAYTVSFQIYEIKPSTNKKDIIKMYNDNTKLNKLTKKYRYKKQKLCNLIYTDEVVEFLSIPLLFKYIDYVLFIDENSLKTLEISQIYNRIYESLINDESRKIAKSIAKNTTNFENLYTDIQRYTRQYLMFIALAVFKTENNIVTYKLNYVFLRELFNETSKEIENQYETLYDEKFYKNNYLALLNHNFLRQIKTSDGIEYTFFNKTIYEYLLANAFVLYRSQDNYDFDFNWNKVIFFRDKKRLSLLSKNEYFLDFYYDAIVRYYNNDVMAIDYVPIIEMKKIFSNEENKKEIFDEIINLNIFSNEEKKKEVFDETINLSRTRGTIIYVASEKTEEEINRSLNFDSLKRISSQFICSENYNYFEYLLLFFPHIEKVGIGKGHDINNIEKVYFNEEFYTKLDLNIGKFYYTLPYFYCYFNKLNIDETYHDIELPKNFTEFTLEKSENFWNLEFQNAEEYLKKANDKYNDGFALYYLGMLYCKKWSHDYNADSSSFFTAEEYLKKSANEYDFRLAKIELGRLYKNLYDLNKSEKKYFEKVVRYFRMLDRDCEDGWAKCILGNLYLSKCEAYREENLNYIEAKNYFEEAISIHDSNVAKSELIFMACKMWSLSKDKDNYLFDAERYYNMINKSNCPYSILRSATSAMDNLFYEKWLEDESDMIIFEKANKYAKLVDECKKNNKFCNVVSLDNSNLCKLKHRKWLNEKNNDFYFLEAENAYKLSFKIDGVLQYLLFAELYYEKWLLDKNATHYFKEAIKYLKLIVNGGDENYVHFSNSVLVENHEDWCNYILGDIYIDKWICCKSEMNYFTEAENSYKKIPKDGLAKYTLAHLYNGLWLENKKNNEYFKRAIKYYRSVIDEENDYEYYRNTLKPYYPKCIKDRIIGINFEEVIESCEKNYRHYSDLSSYYKSLLDDNIIYSSKLALQFLYHSKLVGNLDDLEFFTMAEQYYIVGLEQEETDILRNLKKSQFEQRLEDWYNSVDKFDI